MKKSKVLLIGVIVIILGFLVFIGVDLLNNPRDFVYGDGDEAKSSEVKVEEVEDTETSETADNDDDTKESVTDDIYESLLGQETEEQDDKVNKEEEDIEEVDNEGVNITLKEESRLLDFKYESIIRSLPYDPPQVEYNANSYSYDIDSLFNPGMVDEMTHNQVEMLTSNGFVVLQPKEEYPSQRMHYVNEMSEYEGVPQFVSTDNVLHMFRVFYSESMKTYEQLEYYPRLVEFTTSMMGKSIREYYDFVDKNPNIEIKYYNDELDNSEEDLYYLDLVRITAYFGVACDFLDIEVALPKPVYDLCIAEIENIEKLEYGDSPLFKLKTDYSQYLVRGHYTLNDNLGNYFKAMMWYGQSGFQLTNNTSDQVELVDSVYLSLMITLLTFEGDDINLFTDIYELTNLYSGYADDIMIYDLQEVIKDVYGQVPSLNELRDPKYLDDLYDGILKLKDPQVEAMVYTNTGELISGKQFRMMGQRYTLDADILQSLMEPYVRPYPSALDVFAAFGHMEAENILKNEYLVDKVWDGYDQNLGEMKTLVEDFGQENFRSNLYNGMLWSMDAAARSFEDVEGAPAFMRTPEWTRKNLASALGNYAELKHDNILYSKQAVAQAGGVMYLPYNYVEPNVEVYSRLKWLAQFAIGNLVKKGVIDEVETSYLHEMVKLLEVLESASMKELNGEDLSREEMNTIGTVSSYIDSLFWSYKFQLQEEGIDNPDTLTSATVADIATVLNDGYLEIGSGMPLEIYVICNTNGKSFIARGVTYSFYEFRSSERLTDEKWQTMLGYEKPEGEYAFALEKSEAGPLIDLLETTPWMTSYISNEPNNLTYQYKEVNWDE